MAPITSIQLSIAADTTPDSVVIGVHGPLDVIAAASIQWVVDGILEDRGIRKIRFAMQWVNGTDVAGISGLAAAAAGAEKRGVEFTLSDPRHQVGQELEAEGVSGLVRIIHQDRRPMWRAAETDRSQARGRHPAGMAR